MIDWEATRQRLQASQLALERSLSDEGRLERVLQERARQLAQRKTGMQREGDRLMLLVFSVGQQRYALEVASLARVLPLTSCTPVPGAPEELVGLINVGGEITSVLDLARLLKLPGASERRGYVLLLRTSQAAVGLRVNELPSIENVPQDSLRAGYEGHRLADSPLVQATMPDGLVLLRPRAVLSHPLLIESIVAAPPAAQTGDAP